MLQGRSVRPAIVWAWLEQDRRSLVPPYLLCVSVVFTHLFHLSGLFLAQHPTTPCRPSWVRIAEVDGPSDPNTPRVTNAPARNERESVRAG